MLDMTSTKDSRAKKKISSAKSGRGTHREFRRTFTVVYTNTESHKQKTKNNNKAFDTRAQNCVHDKKRKATQPWNQPRWYILPPFKPK